MFPLPGAWVPHWCPGPCLLPLGTWVFRKYKSDLGHPTSCPHSALVRKRDRKSFLSFGVLGLGSFMDALEPRTLDLQICSKAIPFSPPAHALPPEVGQASDLCSLHTRIACAADLSHPSFIHLSTEFCSTYCVQWAVTAFLKATVCCGANEQGG